MIPSFSLTFFIGKDDLFGDAGGAGLQVDYEHISKAWLKLGLFGSGYGLDTKQHLKIDVLFSHDVMPGIQVDALIDTDMTQVSMIPLDLLGDVLDGTGIFTLVAMLEKAVGFLQNLMQELKGTICELISNVLRWISALRNGWTTITTTLQQLMAQGYALIRAVAALLGQIAEFTADGWDDLLSMLTKLREVLFKFITIFFPQLPSVKVQIDEVANLTLAKFEPPLIRFVNVVTCQALDSDGPRPWDVEGPPAYSPPPGLSAEDSAAYKAQAAAHTYPDGTLCMHVEMIDIRVDAMFSFMAVLEQKFPDVQLWVANFISAWEMIVKVKFNFEWFAVALDGLWEKVGEFFDAAAAFAEKLWSYVPSLPVLPIPTRTPQCLLAPPEFIRTYAYTSARTHISGFDAICTEVQRPVVQLIEAVGADALGGFQDFLTAMQGRRFAKASRIVASTAWCNTLPGCGNAVAVLARGCPSLAHWVRMPMFASSQGGDAEFQARGAQFLSASWQQVAIGGIDWNYADLIVDLSLTISSYVNCGGTYPGEPQTFANVTLRMMQQSVRLRFYTLPSLCQPSCEPLTADLANATAQALRMDELGLLHTRGVGVQRWWSDHSPFHARADVVSELQSDAQGLCDDHRNGTQNVTVDLELEFSAEEPLLKRAEEGPSAQALFLSRAHLDPQMARRAPLGRCQVRCPSGLSLQKMSTTVTELNLSPTETALSPVLARCLDWLRRDYATCGVAKSVADDRFIRCTNATVDLTNLPAWWLTQLPQTVELSTNLSLVGAFDCDTYARFQKDHCACSQDSGTKLTDVAQMGCLRESVGASATERGASRSADVGVVLQRLKGLGYNAEEKHGGSVEDALTVFLCANSGVYHFEQACDADVYPCEVSGRLCAQPSARESCMMPDVSCTQTILTVGSAAHTQLLSASAARWVRMPASGAGLSLAPIRLLPGYTPKMQFSPTIDYGTSWLAEALLEAGRRYHDSYLLTHAAASTMQLVAASARRGGIVHALASGHQTGLQALLVLPEGAGTGGYDWEAIAAQLDALEESGFVDIKVKGTASSVVCALAHRAEYCTNNDDLANG